MYTLWIANKNYSSWSLRPWVLMRTLGIPFEERLVAFGQSWEGQSLAQFSPSGRVPVLEHQGLRIWDSLAIVEYLAERHPAVWPHPAPARAYARSAAAEMHSGFAVLRNTCGMSCGQRVRLRALGEGLRAGLTRPDRLLQHRLQAHGGPWLAGSRFTAVDAFFAPVAFRMQTYGLPFGAVAVEYLQRLLQLPAMQDWYAAALVEPWRDPAHEADVVAAGEVIEDLRA